MYGRVIVMSSRYNSNHINSKKGDTINAAKAAIRKSTLIQIIKVKAANGFH
jgi:hypothetical protein